jgi:recombination protein RecA
MQSSGKSVLALHFVARAQRAGLKCAFIDAEHAFSTEFAERIGVDTKTLIFNAPENGEEGLTVVEDLVESGALDVIVVDSVASLTPKKELEGDLDKQDMALQAKMLAKFLRRVTANVAQNQVILILLNQLRDNFQTFGYGPTTKTPGGHSLKFYASIRLSVSKGNKIKKGEEVIGNNIKIKADKNKCSNPFRECDLEIIYSKGIDLEAELLDKGEDWKVLKKQGNAFFFGETKLGGTKEAAKVFLAENPEVAAQIKNEILKYVKIQKEVEES